MPIQFKCNNCGQAITVSSKLAGKSGKCPKCQNSVKVPAPTTQASAATHNSSASAKARPKAPVSQPSARPGALADARKLDSLLDDVGLVRRTGPICPSCHADIRPGTVVCTKCGYNFQTEKKLDSYDAKIERPEFDNLHLQQAVNNMRRDDVMDQRREKSAMPWWVLASFLIGALLLSGLGVILVDYHFGQPSEETTRIGRIQRLPFSVILGSTVGVIGITLTLFAHLNICIFGFQRKLTQGAACFLLPILFSVPYGIINWTDNKAPIKGLILAALLLGLGSGLIVYGGGFGLLNGVW